MLFPHQSWTGSVDARQMPRETRRLAGHVSGGPSGVVDQSNDLMREAISLGPENAPVWSFTSGVYDRLILASIHRGRLPDEWRIGIQCLPGARLSAAHDASNKERVCAIRIILKKIDRCTSRPAW